jgi:peptidoglycan/LPS O-acetylase OafA/YrhL
MKREFYPYLTIARFLAAVGVATYHGSNSLFGLNPTFRTIFENGYIGVSFFFVLSGFLLGRIYDPQQVEYKAFMRARWVRIYPTYLVCLLIPVAGQLLRIFRDPGLETLLTLVLPILMLQVWVPGYALALLGPAWSLSCEMVFYNLFIFTNSKVRRATALGLVLTVLSTLALPLIVVYWVRTSGHSDVDSTVSFFLYFPPMHFGSFVLGVIAARFRCSDRWASVGVLAGLILISGIVYLPIDFMVKYSSATALPMAVTVLAAAALKPPAAPGLIWRSMLLFGDASYVLYLTHVIVFRQLGHIDLPRSPFGLVVEILIALGVAVLIHLKVEKPLIAWARKRTLHQFSSAE